MAKKGVEADTVEAGLFGAGIRLMIEMRGWEGAAVRLRQLAEEVEDPEVGHHIGNA
jgi:hypothetical protein